MKQSTTLLFNNVNRPDFIVSIYSQVAVKNGIDDLFRKIFSSKHEITETFRTRDTRLLICFIAVVFSGVGCLYDFLHPFPGMIDTDTELSLIS